MTRSGKRCALPVGPKVAIEFERADAAALALFDPDSKVCTMNCGPHIEDPRSAEERKFLCDECWAPNA